MSKVTLTENMTHIQPTKSRDALGCLVLLIALLIGGFALFRNARQPVSFALPAATPTTTPVDDLRQVALRSVLADSGTAPATSIPLPTAYVAPTLPPFGTPILIQPTQMYVAFAASATRPFPVSPTLPGPTAVPSPTGPVVVEHNNRPGDGQWSPPPELVPMSHDLRDHFYFKRPVDANANSTSLFYYPYGSSGPDNAWRVHHGVDMPNPDGQPVRAAADGVVVWAADHYRWVEGGHVVDGAESYGQVVIVAHNFGYNGKQLYTLYAHLSRVLVTINDPVTVGQVVGLSGHTGNVTGPHVHFEVREGDNLYFNTRNPLLWMAPLIGHGVVAGRVLYQDGSPVQGANVSLLQDNRLVDTTFTYTDPKRPGVSVHQVDGDDQWQENFAIGDVQAGSYDVTVSVNGVRLTLSSGCAGRNDLFCRFRTYLVAACRTDCRAGQQRLGTLGAALVGRQEWRPYTILYRGFDVGTPFLASAFCLYRVCKPALKYKPGKGLLFGKSGGTCRVCDQLKVNSPHAFGRITHIMLQPPLNERHG